MSRRRVARTVAFVILAAALVCGALYRRHEMNVRKRVATLVADVEFLDEEGATEAGKELARLDAGRAVESLLARLTQPDLNSLNRPFLIAALAAMGEPAVDHLRPHINWTLTDDRAALESVTSMPDDAELFRRVHTTMSAAEALSLMGVDPTGDLMVTLATGDFAARDAAAVALGRLKDPAAVVPLVDMIAHPISKKGPDEARKALLSIGQAAVKPLVSCLSARLALVRRSAAQQLAEIGTGYPSEPLLALLNDRDTYVRVAAVQALAKLPADEVSKPLAHALRRHLRRCADEARGTTAAEETRHSIPYTTALVKALCDFGTPEATAAIVAELERWFDPVPFGCIRPARWSLSRSLRGRITPALCEAAFASEKYYVRAQAVDWCARLPDSERSVEFLIAALEDEHEQVASRAAILLGIMGDSRAEGPLIEALGHADTSVRLEAALVLGTLGGRVAQAALIRLLDSEEPPVREAALFSLDAIGLPEGRAVVDSIVGDIDLQAVASDYETWLKKGDEARLVLMLALQRHGDEAMARALLRSKDPILRSTTASWDRRNGVDVRKIVRERP